MDPYSSPYMTHSSFHFISSLSFPANHRPVLGAQPIESQVLGIALVDADLEAAAVDFKSLKAMVLRFQGLGFVVII